MLGKFDQDLTVLPNPRESWLVEGESSQKMALIQDLP